MRSYTQKEQRLKEGCKVYNYIVRIYYQDADNHENIVGVAEEAVNGEIIPFHDTGELVSIMTGCGAGSEKEKAKERRDLS